MASRIGRSHNVTAILKECGVGSAHGPTVVEVFLPRKPLIEFVDAWTACIARNGYKLPAPNTSGTGPLFPVGTDRIGRYRAAATHCVSVDRRALAAVRLAARE